MKTGTIIEIQHVPMSGLATMRLNCGNYHCDAGPMFRAIHEAFGEAGPIGQRIVFEAEGVMMTGFRPAETTPPYADDSFVETGGGR